MASTVKQQGCVVVRLIVGANEPSLKTVQALKLAYHLPRRKFEIGCLLRTVVVGTDYVISFTVTK